MLDNYGRTIDYMRISVTDRCNLSCVYCMPRTGVEGVRKEELLSDEELLKICSVFASIGIRHLKLTGGEPLVRKDLHRLIRKLYAIEGIEDVTLTTNGILLQKQLPDLYDAGVRSINVSLDTLQEERYKEITGADALLQVWESIHACMQYKDLKLKINCVPLLGVNEEEMIRMAELAKTYPLDVRFIEMMPIGLGKQYAGISEDILRARLQDAFGEPETLTGRYGNGPSVYAKYPGFKGNIGYISAVSHGFCGTCNRVRLTATGYLKLCLQYADGIDLKKLLRDGIEEEALREILIQTVEEKPAKHHFENEKEHADMQDEDRSMWEIGG